MNILYINNFFHIIGGVDRYFFDLANLMRKKGHNVAFFSSNSDVKSKSKWKPFFIDYIPFSDEGILSRLRYIIRIFYSRTAKFNLARLIDEFKPDIIHIHNLYHQIPASILYIVKTSNIPVIQTVGDYHLVAPNYNLFHNGEICEITRKDKFYKAVFHRCVKSSYLVSLLEVAEKYFYKVSGIDKNAVDLFIVPSGFMKKKLVEYGILSAKITVIPHFTNTYADIGHTESKYVLYFGRISEEKGLGTLVRAMKNLPEIKLKIIGSGPYIEDLELLIKKGKIENVELAGFLEGERLRRVIRNCRFTVLPSVWNEVFGLAVIESFANGKPVIASKIGAIPEIVNRNTGLLFNPGNPDELAEKIKILWSDYNLRLKMGRAAKKRADKFYSEVVHYKKVLKIYNNISRQKN